MVFHASYKKGCKRKTFFLFATFFHYCQIPVLLFNYIKQRIRILYRDSLSTLQASLR